MIARQISANNDRRIKLIEQRDAEGLTAEEQAELNQLQAQMSQHINTTYPLPFCSLDELEQLIDAAERRQSAK